MRMMFGHRNFIWWKICWQFITPTVLATILVVTIVNFSEPQYGTYVYPQWAIGLGWLLALSSLMPIAIFMFFKVILTPGPLLKRVWSLTQPSSNWGPALLMHRTGRYKTVTVLNDPDENSSLNIMVDPAKQVIEDDEKQPLDQEKQPLDPNNLIEKIAIENECDIKNAIA